MDKSVRAKLNDLLSVQHRCNYDDAESMAEELIDEFNESEAAEWCHEITDAVQEWWDSHDDDLDLAEEEEREVDDEEFERQLRRLDRKLSRRPLT